MGVNMKSLQLNPSASNFFLFDVQLYCLANVKKNTFWGRLAVKIQLLFCGLELCSIIEIVALGFLAPVGSAFLGPVLSVGRIFG